MRIRKAAAAMGIALVLFSVGLPRTCAEGENALHVSCRTDSTQVLISDLTQELKQPGIYTFSVKIMLDEPHFEYSKMLGAITVITDTGTFRAETECVNAENGRYVCASATKAINWTGRIKEAYFGIENKVKAEMCGFYADDFRLEYVGKAEENADASETLLVGALRSDGPYSREKLVRGPMKRVLPYYYNFDTDSFENDSDILYAEYAGIDYFAYRPEDGTYRYHGANSVKMCFVIGKNTETEQISALKEYFERENYLKYNGRNLVIFSSAESSRKEAIKKVCPDAIIMTLSCDSAAFGQSVLTASGSEVCTDFQRSAGKDKSLWTDKNAVLISTGALRPPDKSEVLRHILSGIEKAKSGMKTVLLASWNDCNNGRCILPTYKSNARGEYEYADGEMLLDTEIIDGLHRVLNGKDINIRRRVKIGTADTKPNPGYNEPVPPEEPTPPAITEFTAEPAAEITATAGIATAPAAEPTSTSSVTTEHTLKPAAVPADTPAISAHKTIIAAVSTLILAVGTTAYLLLSRRKKKPR